MVSSATPQPSAMAREIAEQPEALRRTLAALLPRRDEVSALARDRRRVLFIGRGTSDHAAIYGRYLAEVHAGVPGALAAPSVATHYDARLDLSDALAISVSQSGATEDIVATQIWARRCGARTVAVTNVEGSPLAQGADLALVTQAGPEVAVPATKTYLTQLVAMAVVATALADGAAREALDEALQRAPEEVARLVQDRVGVDALARRVAEADEVVVSGRGLLLGTALEIALKVEETCLRAVRGYSYADFRHGPISVVKEGVVSVLVAAQDGPLVAPMTDLARDLKQRGATVVGIGGDQAFQDGCDDVVAGPALEERIAPLGLIVPAQLAIEQTARAAGLDPDNPRGLAKVTRTEAG